MKDRIYFAAAGGRIKIGTTTKRVSDRVTAINHHLSKPLKVIGFIAGGVPLERAVHKHLDQYRLKGEWFRDCEDLRKEIDRIIAIGPAAIGFKGRARRPEAIRRIPPGNKRSIGRLARVIWGERALVQLMTFTGAPPVEITKWLDGSADMPRLIRYAFSAVVMQYIGDDDPPDFLEDDEGEVA
jgi:hypothetical protein